MSSYVLAPHFFPGKKAEKAQAEFPGTKAEACRGLVTRCLTWDVLGSRPPASIGLISSAFLHWRAAPLICWSPPTRFSFHPAHREPLAPAKPLSPSVSLFTPVCSIRSAVWLPRGMRQAGFVLWVQLDCQSQQGTASLLPQQLPGRGIKGRAKASAQQPGLPRHMVPLGAEGMALSVSTTLQLCVFLQPSCPPETSPYHQHHCHVPCIWLCSATEMPSGVDASATGAPTSQLTHLELHGSSVRLTLSASGHVHD